MKTVSANQHLNVHACSLNEYDRQKITISGAIYRIRKLGGGLFFIVIRDGESLIQCKLESNESIISIEEYSEGDYVSITGICQKENRAPHGAEIKVQSIEILSKSTEEMPFSINQKLFEVGLDSNLNFRPISLRHPKQRAIFAIQSAISMLFRQGLSLIDFTEIHTPKLVFAGAEGGANVFKVKYFERELFLAQSPQFYKQMMVGVFGKVMEVGPVFRAEPHETSRHLNEYTSMDLEVGPIKSFEDIMEIETYLLRYIFEELPKFCSAELKLLEVSMPQINNIPIIKMSEALEIISKNRKIKDRSDLDPQGEQIICQYIFKETGSEFVFVTHYPTIKRPVYAMEDPENNEVTLSFDLLFRGLEITTGGQRIHDYKMQVEKMKRLGYNPDDFVSYLQIHKYGMPPHGGFGLGLERLTMQLLNLSSIKEACLFPRTINRITP
ncbi:MAG: tRNA synthetase class II (D K and N) [Candidatus Nomurabacteria bacterium GW2011_GWE1_32_28]|uniref:Aspartate--tRNA(Asp/Asn) ligase n=1 Tax=Candidatus Nomurabacteria bacterium GW2011_GWF1_31_48 TaxID=1618767 RepID=A0A0F9YTN5_9BACT|nr:MAG: tRNA synthetase class II (D K and N) [Candidatus Nomurabacteria bacterium GW2011_GWF2_30_133]KKP28236.1 MAG: tRNA synthetase class II (D K and N) [Candidatus Nomurabacteria bacterium GW2011_GWE2_31_40]KKP29831.1 MAG: tRNA synthetase class II (D K and N) [Candidatus Nomurabacteria bacterium GW2011_GWF1_31_48]KKP34572.1 MAG: tRNA synthetase class II (D K and N) [Candidatus Nomurabacteria bacterium GW2011_GWE1_32_28]HAS80444.1 aspartate--tRNA(Asn) ligase [Candidatus Nomurabacteria bacteriu